jgi:O-methyltransferase involved in polyketide biosynthesis
MEILDPQQIDNFFYRRVYFSAVYFLHCESIIRLIDQVTQLSVPGSWLGFDIINGLTLTHPLTRNWIDMQAVSGAPWIRTMDDLVKFLFERGWQASLSQAGADDANHGRWPYPVIPVTSPEMPHDWYVTARKELEKKTK